MRLQINANNVIGRSRPAFAVSGFRFPTTKSVEEALVEIQQEFDKDLSLIEEMFPESATTASSIEMYMVRNQHGSDRGMTYLHQIGSNVQPVDTRVARVDLAKAEWSPLAFKESRTWDEKEMLYLGRLTEEVQASEIDEQISEFLAWGLKRMRNRRRWLCWQVMLNGQIQITGSEPDNPNKLQYVIPYGITDMQLTLAQRFDAKDANGNSLTDPVKYFRDLIKASTYKPELRPVQWIANSGLLDVLADNTFMQYYVDYERGLFREANWQTATVRPPQEVYRNAVQAVFEKYTGVKIRIVDDTYEDDNGNVQFWIPLGKSIVLFQNTAPLGTFKYTAHVAGTDAQGRVLFGTGPYVHIDDKTKETVPKYEIVMGFHGLPQIQGYNPRDFSFHRIKWLDFASSSNAGAELPAFPSYSYRYPLG